VPEAEAERVREAFNVPDEFRAFMRKVVVKIDWSDEGGSLMGADALQDECGHGGRIETELYRFVYVDKDGAETWTVTLREQQIRDIANGDLTEIDADRERLVTRSAKGNALLVWGEFADDALAIRTQRELGVALDALHAAAEAPDSPQTLRLWSTKDDQLFAVIYGDQCAIYVIESAAGYGTSAGDPTRTEAFDITDQDVGALTVPWSDCVPWDAARAALLRFAEAGELGTDITLDGRIPVTLLGLSDCNREAELETRPKPVMDPARTSLMRINPFAMWARRLLDSLRQMELVELLDTAYDRVLVELAPLLHAHGEKAFVSPRSADRIASELGAIRGVDRMFATGSDVQTALRRTKDPA
jgi:hypothetical protein